MKRRSVLLLILAAATCVGALAAEKKPLPKDLPPYGALKPLSPPVARQEKLPNGLSVWLVPVPGVPKVAFVAAIRGGLAYDPKDRPGLSEFLMQTVDQGTKTRSAKQIAEAFQVAGGDLSSQASSDSLLLSTSVLASETDRALSALSDVLQNATFPEREVEIARRNEIDGLHQQETDPGFLAARALAKVVYGDHPYSVVAPTEESLTRATAAELRQAYAGRFAPASCLLIAVGDFQPEALMTSVNKYFASWNARGGELPALPAVPDTLAHVVNTVARPDSVQTTLLWGELSPRRGDADYAAAQVADAIFGGMFGSRMINNVREDKGYSYSPFSFVQSKVRGGLLRAQADVRNAVTGAALNEVNYELNRMATTSVTEEEVTRARRYLVGLTAIRLQTSTSVARDLANLWIFNLPPEELGGESEKILQVKGEQVDAIGHKYYPASHSAIVAVGEPKVIEEQLQPFGIAIRPAPSAVQASK